MSDVRIRPATRGDVPGILSIYNEIIENSTAVYALTPTTLAEREAWYDARIKGGYPVLVAVPTGQDNDVLGLSTFGEFRGAWPGYRYTVEHSIHVRADQRGRGLGPRLLSEIFPLALAMGKHAMVGAIDASNEGSLRMHERLGFKRVAHFPEVGHKFGRWLDLVFMQRLLDAPGSPRPS